jgi:hypothetical protein
MGGKSVLIRFQPPGDNRAGCHGYTEVAAKRESHDRNTFWIDSRIGTNNNNYE